ncbi:MAG: extracellular solute-binding protein [Oscillospiraceae bacterium]
MKNTMFRRVISSALALALAATSCIAVLAETTDESTLGTQDINAELVDASNRENAYSNYVKKYADAARPEQEVIINGADFISKSDSADITVTTVDGKDNVAQWANQEGSVTYEFEVAETGVYNIEASYEALAGGTTSVEFALLIDDVCPYTTASRITLPKRWVNETGIEQDAKGNDIRPGQVEEVCWQTMPFKDIDGLSNEPLRFYIEAGKHTLTLQSSKAQFALEYLKLYQYKIAEAYVAADSSDIAASSAEVIKLEGELADYKSDRTLFPTNDRNSYLTSSATGSSPTKTKYNTIGKDSWNKATQAVTWKFNVEKDGYYKVGIRARQDTMRGMYSNRRMYIDGVVPCLEAEQIKFYYDTEWNLTVPKAKNGQIMYFYLEAGTHEITLEAVPGEIGEIMGDLDEIVYNVNSYYRRIRQITGPDPDEYNNYMIDKAIPGIIDDFKTYSESLRTQMKRIEELSGQGGTEAVTLDKLAIVLDKCTEKPDRIPQMMSQIKDNVTSVSSWINQYREQPLEIDMIEIATSDKEFTSCDRSFFAAFGFGFRAFIGSFFEDYNSLTDEDDSAMVCWISLGRDNALVVQNLINNEYNPTAKTKINMKLVQGGIVEATFAGKGPDLALFMGGDFPIQLAARGVLTDLSQFSDYDEVMQRFSPDAGVLYEYNGGSYGLPVSQTFPMLFYRSDILDQYGIDPATDLNTWDGLIETLPILQRNYMEVGLILPVVTNVGGQTAISPTTEAGNTFATMLLQQGINYYDEAQTKTNFDTQEAINAFDTWTKFYTTYSFQQTYDAFTRFRTGDMPVLIQNYTFFNQLSVAAPEIKGCWGFQPVPGTVQEDGTINHASNSQGSGAIIFKKAKDQQGAWEFIKWFTSKEVQVEYGNDIESILGTMGRFDTANVEALGELSWTSTEVALLKEQLLSQVEIPVIPASYGVTRNLMNAFREVVNNYENARDTLFWYNKDINDEITRKREDLGLNDQ